MGKKINSPGISIIIPTLNSSRTIGACLSSIQKQDYPRNKIEVLLLDGGSTDKTLEIAKSIKGINLKVIAGGFKNNMEARRYIGFQKAKFPIIGVVDSDNYLIEKTWIKDLVYPMTQEPDIVGSFTLHYYYDPKQSLANRYFALIGANDPVAMYLQKNDRLKWIDKNWTRKNQIVKQTKKYTLVKFDEHDFPTLGCNGFLIRKEFVHLKGVDPETFFHTDILFDLLSDGRDKYAVVNRNVLHDTSHGVINHIKKRIQYMSLHHVKLSQKRRYKVFNSDSVYDIANLFKFSLFSLTLVQPILFSLFGFIKQPDIAWFVHPIMVFFFFVGYAYSTVKGAIAK